MEEGPEAADKEPFKGSRSGKSPGSPRFVSRKRVWARTATGCGRVHIESEDIPVGFILPLCCLQKREEFFFGYSFTPHVAFSHSRG